MIYKYIEMFFETWRYDYLFILIDTYGNETKILYANHTDHDITNLTDGISQDVKYIEEYAGNFANLLKIAPHIALFTVNEYSQPKIDLTVAYNDTMQHSLPILINLLSNTYYRYDRTFSQISNVIFEYLCLKRISCD